MNIISLVLLLLCSLPIYATTASQLSVKWTGIAGVLISDGETDLGFDLTMTKPELKHWLFNSRFLPDEDLLKASVKKYDIKKLDALFISHTHCDHAVDIPWFSAEFSAPIYGTISIHRLAKAYSKLKDRKVFLQDMKPKQTIQVGEFKITPFTRIHAPILQMIDWHFLEGDVPENTSLNFYDYYTGDTWSYLVEHPLGNIYVEQGGQPVDAILNFLPKIDIAILGTANKKSVTHWIEGYGIKLKPKVVMPVHYDWFLHKWPNKPFVMPGMDLEKLESELKKLNIKFQFERIIYQE